MLKRLIAAGAVLSLVAAPTIANAQALARTQVVETWVAGKKVWSRPASAVQPERGK